MERLPAEVYDRVDRAILALADELVREAVHDLEAGRTGVCGWGTTGSSTE
jgi:TolB-like protein